MSDASPPLQKKRLDPTLLIALAFNQMIGWGTTFYLPSVISASLQKEIGLSSQIVFSAVAAMMITGAIFSPMLGRHLDRSSIRPVMVMGSVLCSAGLLILSQAQGMASYLLAWVVIGISSIMILTLSAHAAVVKAYHAEARRALTILVVSGGWSVTIFWPLTEYLLRMLTWRDVVIAYGLLHLCVCAPLHFLFVDRTSKAEASVQADVPGAQVPAVSPRLGDDDRRIGFLLMVLAFAPAGFVSWGLPLHFVELFQGAGIPVALAVFLGSLSGPSQMVARLLQWFWLDRWVDPVKLAFWSLLLTIPALTLPLFLVFDVVFAATFVVIYGISSGWTSMARATLPLVLFGSRGFASLIGRLSLPLNVIFAVSPMFYAWVIETGGSRAALFLSVALCIVSGLACFRLTLLARPAVKTGP